MSKEQRTAFEAELQIRLRERLTAPVGLKVTKNKISLSVDSDRSRTGILGLQYLQKAGGYMLTVAATNGAFTAFYERNPPPYRSNLPPEWQYAMNSLMEKFKVFAQDIGGTVPLPTTDAAIDSTCGWICEKLNTIYLPRLSNFLLCTPGLIADIIENPDYYDYPIPMIACAISSNALDPRGYADRVLIKRLLKNKAYDSSVLLGA